MAFCFRIKATYEVGLLVAVDRPEVERRGKLELMEVVVGCRCILYPADIDESREWVVGGRALAATAGFWKELEGSIFEDTVRVCWCELFVGGGCD